VVISEFENDLVKSSVFRSQLTTLPWHVFPHGTIRAVGEIKKGNVLVNEGSKRAPTNLPFEQRLGMALVERDVHLGITARCGRVHGGDNRVKMLPHKPPR
jgi:hypothetical protein